MKHYILTSLGITLVLGLLALAACAPAGGPIPNVIPTTTPIQPPTTEPTRPLPTSTPVTLAHGPVVLSSIHMLTLNDGWAIGEVQGAGGQSILRTLDGGAHWLDASPPGVSSSPAVNAYFDPFDAWVAAASFGSANSSSITVYHTSDGGQTWQAGAPISLSDGGGPGLLDFIDSQHGWMMAGLGAAAGSEGVAILQTTDGGMHWRQVSLTSGDPGQSTPGSLPFSCIKSGITFLDASAGWATGSCAGGKLFFYVTHDAGKTWQSQIPAAPPGYPADILAHCMCTADPPQFLSSRDGVATIGIYESSQSAFLYTTHDGGATWNPEKLPVASLPSKPNFISANDGWLTDWKQLYATHDGGQNWTTLGKLPTPDMRGGLDFLDVQNGWLTDGAKLYATHDGGKTWTTITPLAFVTSIPSPTPTTLPNGPPSTATPALIGQNNIPLPRSREPIHFARETSFATVTVDLVPDVPRAFTLHVIAGQQMYITTNGAASVQIYDWQDRPLTGITTVHGPWGVGATETGDYDIALLGVGQVTLSVYVPPTGSNVQLPVPVPTASQRISFAPGATSATLNADLVQGAAQGFALEAEAGQRMIAITSSDVTLALLNPQGQALSPISQGPGKWEFALAQTGEYTIVAMGEGRVTLIVSIPPALSSGTPAVTLGDNGRTITLHVGQRFLLELGEGYIWTVDIDHPLVVSRVVNVLTIRGSQGLYEALSPGYAALTAVGDLACRSAQPPCEAPSRVFELYITVQ